MSDVEDMERFNKDCLELTTTGHFLRYVSECNPLKGKAKGGYLVGRVNVPFKGEKILMTIDIVPSFDLVKKIIQALPEEQFPHLSPKAAWELAMTHPNLVHHFRFERNGNRACKKEPALFNHSWKLEYIIDEDMNIIIRNKKCILDSERPDVAQEEKVGSLLKDKKGFFFRLTKNEGQTKTKVDRKFCLAPLQPKQSRSSELEPNIDSVLADRLIKETQEVRDIIKSFYANENAQNIWMFRLRVQFKTEAGLLLEWGTSGDIKDTKNIKTGSMDIFGVTNKKSCYHGGRLITIKSMWDLDKRSVKPRLQVYDEKGAHLENMTKELLIQPSDITVEKCFVDFLSPPQNAENIEKIYNRKPGNTIKLLLKRSESDGFESNKKVTFQYIPCGDNCDYCQRNVDGDCVEEKRKLEKGKRKANPGFTRRTLDNDKRSKIDPIEEASDSGLRDAFGGPPTSSIPTNPGFPGQNYIVEKIKGCDRQTSTESDSGVSVASGSHSTHTSHLSPHIQIWPNGLSQVTLSYRSASPGEYPSAINAPHIISNDEPSVDLGQSSRELAPVDQAFSATWAEMVALTQEELGDESPISIEDVFMGPTCPRIQKDGFKREIKAENSEDLKTQMDELKREIIEADAREPWLDCEEEDSSDQYSGSMALAPLLIWSPVLLVAATHGLSPSTLLVGIMALVLAKILD